MKLMILASAFLLVFGLVGSASALIINTTETFGTGTTNGITCVPSGWVWITGNKDNDVGIDDAESKTGVGDRYMWLEDDAVVGARINTTGFDTISLAFDWRTFRTNDSKNDSDELRVGYAISAIQPGAWSDFTELDYITDEDNWVFTSYSLAESNTSDLWVGFFLDDGNSDYGFVDNVLLSGTLIDTTVTAPEPATLFLLGTGLIGLAGFGRRKLFEIFRSGHKKCLITN